MKKIKLLITILLALTILIQAGCGIKVNDADPGNNEIETPKDNDSQVNDNYSGNDVDDDKSPNVEDQPSDTPVIEENKVPVKYSSYYTGTIQPSNRTQEEIDNEVLTYYNKWKKKYIREVEGTSPVQKYIYYNTDGYFDIAVTCSEAHGYGMLTTVLMADVDPEAKEDFNAMYRFYKAHPSIIQPTNLAWQQVEIDGQIVDHPDGGNDSATDGDMDIAYALLLADKKWGSAGDINYGKEALACIQGLMDSVVNQSEWILKMGDWAWDKDPKYGCQTRPSDFMLNHIRVFAARDTENADKWMNVHEKIQSIINEQYKNGTSNETGLMPDFMYKGKSGQYIPVEGMALESNHDGDYSYNSCRTPWRLSMDYLTVGDEGILEQLTTLNQWIRTQTGGLPSKIRPGYYIANGTPGNSWATYQDMSFIAPFAVAAMIDESNQEWLNSLWDYIVKTNAKPRSYYGDCIKMLVMITVSGKWVTPLS